MENWRAVVGYEGHYEVSDLGRVRSLARVIPRTMPNGSVQHQNRPEKMMGQASHSGAWYARVTLHLDHQRKTISVHTLVLEAFVGPAPEGQECRHLDGDMGNNRLTNLEWGTHRENEDDKLRHGRVQRGEAIKNSVLTEIDVLVIRERHRRGERQRALASEYSVSPATINRTVHRQCWRHVA